MAKIKILHGDLLKCKCPVIGHQVNTIGVMGAGLALQIRRKWPNVFKEYNKYSAKFESHPDILLGTILITDTDNTSVIGEVCNMFAQNMFINKSNPVATNYNALESCLYHLSKYCRDNNFKSVGLPYNLGCGLAGGDWNVVYPMIEKAFEDYEGTVEIWNIED